ncbi:GNAT family N-acetyltransferase [Moraxella nasovis]|uniref:GNAT family N-acetyltransferase n=1 Tax=Moraxella nasovis TaxID=2904121 RepID=UPI001F60A61D|nr:GNAT family N-acetyltransferase [Moraxella nasovis]UNU73643.1 GNAT family N-acetyltransferase [Moraxella nasovis]
MFVLLDKSHDRQAFDCGNEAINRYLKTMANQHAKKNIAKTHVLSDGAKIQAFYTLSNAHFDNDGIIKGYPRQIPIITIGRIGVSRDYQGQGLSKKAIRHALEKIKALSTDTGITFAMIDAKNEALASYYERLGFIRINNGLKLAYPVSQI